MSLLYIYIYMYDVYTYTYAYIHMHTYTHAHTSAAGDTSAFTGVLSFPGSLTLTSKSKVLYIAFQPAY